MSRVLLKPDGIFGPRDLSQFHSLVSAYETVPENVERLALDLEHAIVQAKASTKSVVVDHDCLEHVFIVHPSGAVTLYREISSWTLHYRSDNE